MSERKRRVERGFTLIELLVVVAIIAILISILLPALNNAREQSRAVVCAANQRQVGQSAGVYLAENKGAFPCSYIYANNASGGYDLNNQPPSHPFGYLHWSWFLYNRGQVFPAAFQCPTISHKGIPRTNPGKNAADWEFPEQVDQDNGRPGPSNNLEDLQAPRMAFTANAAVMPRNKFTTQLSGGPRINRFVRDNEIRRSGSVIMAAEFSAEWKNIGVPQGGNVLVKSHRSINPFYHLSSGENEYLAPPDNPDFIYGDPRDRDYYGLRPLSTLVDKIGVIEGDFGPITNAVGRHHPGGDRLGGTTNFLYCDGHVARKTILETMRQREWGEKYYSLTGANDIQYGN